MCTNNKVRDRRNMHFFLVMPISKLTLLRYKIIIFTVSWSLLSTYNKMMKSRWKQIARNIVKRFNHWKSDEKFQWQYHEDQDVLEITDLDSNVFDGKQEIGNVFEKLRLKKITELEEIAELQINISKTEQDLERKKMKVN